MSRRIVVHIGLPKTASSAIQRMLRQSVASLARSGVRVVSCRRRSDGGRSLVGGARNGAKLEVRRAAMANRIRLVPGNTFVISDERMTGRHGLHGWPDWVAGLAESVAAEVRVVAYVRPQHQMLESWHCQKTRNGRSDESFERFMADMLENGSLDYCEVFEPWRKLFGTANVRVTPLEPSRLGGDVRDHFLGLLGVEGAWTGDRGLRPNARLGAKELEVRRMVSTALIRAGIPRRMRRRLMGEKLGSLDRLVRRDVPYAPLSPAGVQEVAERYADSNARFARAYGIDAAGELFRNPLSDGFERPNRTSWSRLGKVERFCARLYVRYKLGIRLPPGGR